MTSLTDPARPLRSPGRPFGVWSGLFRIRDTGAVSAAAAELEEAGWAALWYPGGNRNTFEAARVLLDATRHVAVATGITNIWFETPEDSAAHWARLEQAHPGRFILGLGSSHEPLVRKSEVGTWGKPLSRMRDYLDQLDAQPTPVSAQDRVVAALGPKMLALAAERSLGTHPYLVTVEQEAAIRERIGPEARVLSEVGVVLDSDPTKARETARQALAMYMTLPNYVNNWIRAGFTPEDTAGGGSDRLIDALVAWGPLDRIASRLRAHLDAGADHVCVQVLGTPAEKLPLEEWRVLADVLELS